MFSLWSSFHFHVTQPHKRICKETTRSRWMAMILAYHQHNLNKVIFLCIVTKFRQKTKGCMQWDISLENTRNCDGGVSGNIKPQKRVSETQVGTVFFLWIQSLLIYKVKQKFQQIFLEEKKSRDRIKNIEKVNLDFLG